MYCFHRQQPGKGSRQRKNFKEYCENNLYWKKFRYLIEKKKIKQDFLKKKILRANEIIDIINFQ